MEQKQYKLIFNAGVARKLLKMNCQIVDIKADHENKDKTVFVFEKTDKFESAFAQINEEIKKSKSEEVL